MAGAAARGNGADSAEHLQANNEREARGVELSASATDPTRCYAAVTNKARLVIEGLVDARADARSGCSRAASARKKERCYPSLSEVGTCLAVFASNHPH